MVKLRQGITGLRYPMLCPACAQAPHPRNFTIPLFRSPLAHPDVPQPVALHQAAYNSPIRFALKGAAPDGQYLVVCVREQQESPVARTLLYDVAADRWDTLAEGPHCLNVVSM